MGIEGIEKLNLYAKYEKGKRNSITDVAGVKVGHATLEGEGVNTGVTAVIPCEGNVFKGKLFAGVWVVNGYGKSVGLMQIEELGTLESPILMTNTLSVGTALTALVKYMLGENPEIGVKTGTVNCVVTECNDGEMNDIRGLHVTEEHVFEALASASVDFAEGDVGAGRGMEMMGLSGGIGSSSRLVKLGDFTGTIGVLALTNYGASDELVVGGDAIGRRINASGKKEDKGSCIIIMATDIPMIDRQLKRLAARSAHALARTGSYSGNGSGDLAIAFSTANRIEHFNREKFKDIRMIYDEELSPVFEAAVEATEEALISSLAHARTMTGVRGKKLRALSEFL